MYEGSWVVVKRDIEAITIPYGSRMSLPSDTQVRLAQSFGDSFTVVTDLGIMCRVDGKDADAIGETCSVPGTMSAVDPDAPFDEQKVWDKLRTVYDPEIPVNIVDLGLVYECKGLPIPEGGHRVELKMTMTAPGCGMGEVLKQDAERKVATVPGVKEVHVDIVFEPQWNFGMMSEAARLQLGI